MYETRIKHLEDQHATLDRQIDNMEKTGHFNDLDLQYLKKKRLKIQDELADLRRRQHEHNQEVGHDD